MKMAGDLDPFRIDATRDEIRTAALIGGHAIELDCEELTFIGPDGIGMLLELGRELGKRVVFTSMSVECRHRFRMMGVESVFEFR